MNLRSKPLIFSAMILAGLNPLFFTSARAQNEPPRVSQTAPGQKPLMAEEAFKNVQLLRGISVKEFMETRGFFSAATNKNCTGCHGEASAGSWEKYADDVPMKQTARRMILMVDALNKTYFGGKREVTCYSCHRNADRPKITPNLPEQYGTPPPEESDEIAEQDPDAPSPDQVLDSYIQAVGGQKLATVTSFFAKGTYEGYDYLGEKAAVEIYAKAPMQFAQFVHSRHGDSVWVFDGRSAWVAQPATDTPVPLVALTAGDLDGAKVEAELLFPLKIKQSFTKWRTGSPVSGLMNIVPGSVTGVEADDRNLTVLQGTTPDGNNNVRLYFDTTSGLIVRMLRYTNLPVEFITTQIEYDDYRDVAGIKMPFRITKTWVDGRSVVELSSIQPNVAIDAAKFARPPSPAL
jgi:outer membrane lipoprotein-sorting protein